MSAIPELSVSVRQEKRQSGGAAAWGCFWREPRRPGHTKRQRRAKYFATEAEARAWAADLVEMAQRLATAPPPAAAPAGALPTAEWRVADYLAWWLRGVKEARTAATYRSYEGIARVHIVPGVIDDGGRRFGDLRLRELGTLIVRELYKRLGANLATRRHVHSCLSAALTTAAIDGLIPSNPCLLLGRTLRKADEHGQDPEPNPFTREEAAAFLTWIGTHAPRWLAFFTFLQDTGIRIGELAALKWACVDLVAGTALIEASFSPSAGKDKDPKTHQRRTIDLSKPLIALLITWRQTQRIETLAAGRTPREYVFTSERTGAPMRQDGNLRRVWNRAIRGAKITERRTPHSFRDAFASWHLTADYKRIGWVQKQLGHADKQTTLTHYFKFMPDAETATYINAPR
jgi:integrase